MDEKLNEELKTLTRKQKRHLSKVKTASKQVSGSDTSINSDEPHDWNILLKTCILKNTNKQNNSRCHSQAFSKKTKQKQLSEISLLFDLFEGTSSFNLLSAECWHQHADVLTNGWISSAVKGGLEAELIFLCPPAFSIEKDGHRCACKSRVTREV